MRIAVAIPTLGRGDQVGWLLEQLEHQTRLPDEVVLSAPDRSHVGLPDRTCYPVTLVRGPTGLCAQRNTALRAIAATADIVTFFDDDFVPASDYLAGVVGAFAANPDFAVVMGRVVRDGASTAGIAREEALAVLEEAGPAPPLPEVVDHLGAYGCNMSIRVDAIGQMLFDERLVLYGWQEDVDFTSRLRSRGRVVAVSALRGVHLGLKSGRVSGERLGYSQVVNPIYLLRKGSLPTGFALRLMLRNLTTNLVRSLQPEPYVDRRGRLRGNVLALAHVLRGRIEPEHILKL